MRVRAPPSAPHLKHNKGCVTVMPADMINEVELHRNFQELVQITGPIKAAYFLEENDEEFYVVGVNVPKPRGVSNGDDTVNVFGTTLHSAISRALHWVKEMRRIAEHHDSHESATIQWEKEWREKLTEMRDGTASPDDMGL